MDALERRVAELEQNQNSIGGAQPLLITSDGAEAHYGNFAVESAGKETIINRSHDEPWKAFKARLSLLAFEQQRSPLSIIFFFPTPAVPEAENS